jgi:hypothetical protein
MGTKEQKLSILNQNDRNRTSIRPIRAVENKKQNRNKADILPKRTKETLAYTLQNCE